MDIEILPYDFSICKVNDLSQIDLNREFVFLSHTDNEISVVCPCENVPKEVICQDKIWKCFRICGILDFSLIGILYSVSKILAESKIGIFAVSTYNTDYIFVKAENMQRAVNALAECGINIVYLK